ncbi:MAG: hypothetical protein O7D91_11490 [Planctomycetota bacterium]|nr:hypothetical protein [Planctomycetota bacterium]
MEIEKATERVDFYKQLVDQLVGFVPDTAVVATVVEQVGKDLRMGQILRREGNGSNGSNGWNGSDEQPATAKQIGFLRRLGMKDIPAGLSKREASRAIDEAQQAELRAAA